MPTSTAPHRERGGSTEQTQRYLGDGIYLVDLKVAGMDFRAADGQPVLEYPEPAPVGKTWSVDHHVRGGST